jgi:hypothetical protein
MVTGEHYLEDLKLRVPYRTPIALTEADYLTSKDLHRAVAQNLVKIIPYASVPGPYPNQQTINVNLQGLETQVEELRRALAISEKRNQTFEERVEQQGHQLTAILEAVGKIADRPVTTTIINQSGNGSSAKSSEVVGGEVPRFIPDNIDMGEARINTQASEGEATLEESARKLREVRKKQAGG